MSVGAVEDKEGLWAPASYSNHGAWVDLVARGSNLQSTFAHETTKVAQGPVIDANSDPSVAFDGWAEWDGTSFSTPIAAAMIARTMTRTGIYYAPDAAYKLTQQLAERRAGGLPEREAGRRAALTPTTHALMIGA